MLTLKVFPDETYDSDPRSEYSHLGTIVGWHDHYYWDEDGARKYGSPSDFLNSHRALNGWVVLPVYLLNHSGLRISTGSFHDPWDSGQIGFIFCSRAQLEFFEYPTRFWRKRASEILTQEIQELDDVYSGNVWAYTITDESGSVLDSCYGYIGDKSFYQQKATSQLAFFQAKADEESARIAAIEIGLSLQEV